MSHWNAAQVVDVPTRCDESGICELADEIRYGNVVGLDRLVETCAEWATVVDIAPVVLGHLLVLPFEHKLRTAQLGADSFAKYWDHLGETASSLASVGLGQVASVEHGTPNVRNPMSCVRHCHMHVCPVADRFRTVDDVVSAVETHVDIEGVHFDWQESYGVLSGMDEYMLVRLGDAAVVGRPRSGIRQISRALLVALNDDSEIRDVDWVLEAENQAYFNTLKLLKG